MQSETFFATTDKLDSETFKNLTCELEELELNYNDRPRITRAWNRLFEYPWAFIESDLQPTDVVLDVGTGRSPFPLLVAKKVAKVYCVDIKEMETLKRESNRLSLNNIVFKTQDASILNFEDNFFDKVFCISVLEHTGKKLLKIVHELLRASKKILLVTVDVLGSYMTREELNSLLSIFNVEVPSIPKNALTSGDIYTVCLKVTKHESHCFKVE